MLSLFHWSLYVSGVMVYVNDRHIPDTICYLSAAVRLLLQFGDIVYRAAEDKAGAPAQHESVRGIPGRPHA